MAGWFEMPLGMEVDLGPGDFVIDGHPAPPPQKGEWSPPILGPCLLWPNGRMDESGTNLVLGAEVGFSPGDFVLDGDPAPSLKRGGTPLPNFRPISIVAKRLDASRCHLVRM